MNEIHYLLGNSCNLDCDFCFWDQRLPPPPKEVALKVIDEIKKANIRRITFSGGEPTTYPYLKEALQYARQNKFEIILHTNGLTLNRRTIEELAPLVDRISLSLDGSTPKMGIAMRKSAASVSHTLKLLDLLPEMGIDVNVKTLVTKVNEGDILNIGASIKEKPILYWSLLQFNPVNRGNKYKNRFNLSSTRFRSICQKVKRAYPSLDIRFREFRDKPDTYCFINCIGKVYTFIPSRGDVLVGDIKKNSLFSLLKKFLK